MILNYEDFKIIFLPIQNERNPMALHGVVFNDAHDAALEGQPLTKIWSVRVRDDGKYIAVPGHSVVNRIGYIITQKPFEDFRIEVRL